MLLDGFDHFGVVVATDYVLAVVFQHDVETLVPVGIIAEILADEDVAEIAPVAKESAASAQSQSAGRRIEGVDLLYVGISENFIARQTAMNGYPCGCRTDCGGTIV